jgi:hypothetical protein
MSSRVLASRHWFPRAERVASFQSLEANLAKLLFAVAHANGLYDADRHE